MVAEARHLGRSVWGGAHRSRRREWSKAAGRLRKHRPTQPVAEDVGVEIRRLQHVGVTSVESRAGPHVCGHPQGQSENGVQPPRSGSNRYRWVSCWSQSPKSWSCPTATKIIIGMGEAILAAMGAPPLMLRPPGGLPGENFPLFLAASAAP